MIRTSDELKWYVAHTITEYENKVKDSIEKIVENRNIGHLIADVKVPMQDVVEEKEDGTKKVVQRKIYPGYVFVKMIMTNETWYIVRNTRGCTGFVGPGSEPVPLSEKEVERMGVETVVTPLNFDVGDTVRITEGSMEGFMGEVLDINRDRKIVNVMVTMFGGREMQVEFDFRQVEPLE
ncbi:MAG: transcription termination/antitermination factor NusG [Oscillospiraceae bacterium]|nr:transcription termination/antitermination factor NusG [Oscillospiraceae bacterium]